MSHFKSLSTRSNSLLNVVSKSVTHHKSWSGSKKPVPVSVKQVRFFGLNILKFVIDTAYQAWHFSLNSMMLGTIKFFINQHIFT